MMCAEKALNKESIALVDETTDQKVVAKAKNSRAKKTTNKNRKTRASKVSKSQSDAALPKDVVIEETIIRTPDTDISFSMTSEAIEEAYRDKELMDEYADIELQKSNAYKKNKYSFGSSGTTRDEDVQDKVSVDLIDTDVKAPASYKNSLHASDISDEQINKEMRLVQEFLDKVTPEDFSDSTGDNSKSETILETYVYPPSSVNNIAKEQIEVIPRPSVLPPEYRVKNPPVYSKKKDQTKSDEFGSSQEQLFKEVRDSCPNSYMVDPKHIYTRGMEVPKVVMVEQKVNQSTGSIPQYKSVLPGMPRPFSDNSTGKQLGAEGEALAARFLAARGYLIIELNWRCKQGEVDIVCEQDNTTVLVEVKTRRLRHGESENVWPELNFDEKKYQKYLRLMSEYRKAYKGCSNIRVDVIGIVVKDKHSANLRHILNVFDSWELDNGSVYSSYK